MNSVAIYVRLSEEDMDKQGNIDSRSIANQKSMLTTYCKDRDWDIYDIYCDDGITGMERERPEFQRMLADCENKKVNIVICKDQSRFARDKIIITEYLQTKFVVWGIRFIGVSDNVDSTSGYYLEQTDMNAMFNEWYVRTTSVKINAVFDDMRKKGKFIARHAPYGYIKDPDDKHHLIPDEEVRDTIVRIFDTYNKGASIKSIAIALNEDGIPSPAVHKRNKGFRGMQGNPKGLWTVSGINNILRNETYIGTVVQGKQKKRSYRSKEITILPPEEWVRVPDMHEPIITKEMWEKAQARITSAKRAGRKTQEVTPLTHKVICAECGSTMQRRVSYNNKTGQMYYSMCCKALFYGQNICTNTTSVSGSLLEKECLTAINNAIKTYCDKDELKVAERQSNTIKQLSARQKSISAQKYKVRLRLDNMYTDKLDGMISAEEYLHYKDKFTAELDQYDEQLDKISKQISEVEAHMHDVKYKAELIEKYTDLSRLTMGIADDFIESVTVGNIKEDGSRDINIEMKI